MTLTAGARPYALNLSNFSALKVVDGINVIHKCQPDSAGWVCFDGDENIAPKILFSNVKNQLKIELADDGEPIGHLPVVHVYSLSLEKAENSGDSTLTVITPTPCSQIKFRVVGNGTIKAGGLHATTVEGKIDTGRGQIFLDGKAQTVKLSNTGTGRIDAQNLEAEVGNCKMLGTGPIYCTVNSELIVTGIGSGTVYVKGYPKTIKNRTIGVKIVQE